MSRWWVAVVMVAATLMPAPAHAVTYRWEGVNYGYREGGWEWNFGDHKCWWINDPGYVAGQMCWKESGDYLHVFDAVADGLRVGMEWKTSYGRWGMCVVRTGFHKYNTKGERTCNQNFREGRRMIFRGGVCDGHVHPCGKPGRGSGWYGWEPWRAVTT